MKLIARNNKLLIAIEEDAALYTGYDAFTSDLKHFLKRGSVDVTEIIKRLISDEKVRTELAWVLNKKIADGANMIGCSKKTFHRLLNEYVYEND